MTATEPQLARARELLDRVKSLAREDDQGLLIGIVNDNWDELKRRPPNRLDAETCRLAMLAHYKRQAYLDGYVWRVRTMVRAAAAGWVECVALLVQREALQIQAIENVGKAPTDPEYRVIEQADTIMAEMEPVTLNGELVARVRIVALRTTRSERRKMDYIDDARGTGVRSGYSYRARGQPRRGAQSGHSNGQRSASQRDTASCSTGSSSARSARTQDRTCASCSSSLAG
jgi:hypothetical protein